VREAVQTPGLKPALAAQLDAARRRTLELLAPLSDEDLVKQHSPLMSPLVWDLAHTGHFEELWLLRTIASEQASDGRFDRVYDAFESPRAERPDLDQLSPLEARAYIDDVRSRVLEVLEEIDLDSGDPLLRDGFVYGMIVQHEYQHQETILATLQLRDEPYPFQDEPLPAPEPPGETEALVEGGPFLLGTDEEAWAYDNERVAHEVELPAFWIDTAPVRNASYLEFVEAGGYAQRRYWSEEGWAWRTETSTEHPRFWQREGSGDWRRARLGRRETVPPDEPVQHVCWFEADAYARWAGKRLPTEAEWEKAATWDPHEGKRRFPWGEVEAGPEQANLGQRRFRPAPVGSFPAGSSPWGCHQMLGDVWEWTSSDFLPYPGFEPFPYGEYSEVFFGSEYKVLRGGSWATHPVVARTTVRNWDYPIRRQIFAGFRCARNA
jgi:gamma-glutamyl hercynylcysteine S-oxide synthase